MAGTVETNTKKTFFSGVLWITLSTVLVKIIGLIYKIPMLTYLGSEGMGYFNSAYEIYALFCVISTAGLPVALSVLISSALAKGQMGAVRRIYRAALTVFLAVGTVGSAVMVLFAKHFCNMIRSENAYWCILSIAPTVFFVCLSSALRGYFQGWQKMLPTAISQVIESAGKLLFGLLLARFALQKGFDTATVAAFAGIGLTLGTALSTLYLIVEKIRFRSDLSDAKDGEQSSYRETWKRLCKLAIPMTLGASLVSLTKLIDMTMILRRLQSIGFSEVAANEAYGSYTTLALSVYGLLPALVNGVALPLVPMLSAAIASGDREKQAMMVNSSYRLTALFALPASLGVSAFAQPILSLLFGREPEAVALAAPLLSCLGISVFLSCMITATNSVLHAYSEVNRPILSLVAGAIVKIAAAYFLIGNDRVALMGAPLSTFLCNTVVVLCNLFFASRLCKVKGLFALFFKPFGASVVSIGAALALYLPLSHRMGESSMLSAACILLACLLYLLLSCLFGVFEAEDIRAMPMGDRLYTMLMKFRLIPKDRMH